MIVRAKLPTSLQFPRLQKRGPIEALKCPSSTRAHSRFPRLQKRGPIEARVFAPESTSDDEFPRLQKRGPIEAPWRAIIITNNE